MAVQFVQILLILNDIDLGSLSVGRSKTGYLKFDF